MPDTADDFALVTLDFPTPCAAVGRCARPAAWLFICEHCGLEGPACGVHRASVEREAQLVIDEGGHLLCRRCGRDVVGHFHWVPVRS